MSRETINEARIWCDGCGLTYLEVLNSVEVDAMQRCGWVSQERNGGRQDLCPTCRPDSPFEAVERVRPHWDDDLLAAVLRYLHDPAPLTDDDRAWNIVEAVEDWQNRKEADRRYAITLGRIGGKYSPEWIAQSATDRATKAEAAIALVRELCDLWQRRHDTSIRHPTAIPTIPITAVRRALGPVTETDCHGGDA